MEKPWYIIMCRQHMMDSFCQFAEAPQHPWHRSSGTQAAASFWSLPRKPLTRKQLVNASDLMFACLDYEGSGPLQQMPACLEPCDLSP